jgi:hypothetical protein
LYTRIVRKERYGTFKDLLYTNGNKNISFVKKIVVDKNLQNICNQSETILLIKLLEYFFLQQYNKDLNQISNPLERMNVADFINNNLFLYDSVYDLINKSYQSFKDKVYWNFCEILNSTFSIYQKVIKKIILFHLNYRPQQESLLYNIIQYYYNNREYRKAKMLIRVYIIYKETTFICSSYSIT